MSNAQSLTDGKEPESSSLLGSNAGLEGSCDPLDATDDLHPQASAITAVLVLVVAGSDRRCFLSCCALSVVAWHLPASVAGVNPGRRRLPSHRGAQKGHQIQGSARELVEKEGGMDIPVLMAR